MSNFGNIPQYIIAGLPAPILDVNASGLLDVTGFNSINITGPYAVMLKTATLSIGTIFCVLNSSNVSQCSFTLDNGGTIGAGTVWTVNYFPRRPGAVERFKFDGTNMAWA